MFKFSGYSVTLKNTLVIDNDPDLKLVPALAHRRIRLIWQGSPDQPVIRLIDCPEPYLADIDFDITAPTYCGIEVINSGQGVRPSTMTMFDRLRFFGNGKLGDAVRFVSRNGANNEHGTFRNVKAFGINGYLCHVALKADKQSKEHTFDQCCQEGGLGAVRSPSAFMWRGGTVSGVNGAAFQLFGGGGDRVVIRDVGVEASRRLLDLGTESERTSDGWAVTLEGVRYAADQLDPDGHAVRMYSAGPLVITGCQIGGGKVPVLPHVLVDCFGQPLVRLVGNLFDAFGAYRVSPIWTAAGRETVVDWGLNTYANDDGDPVRCRVLGAWR